MAFLYDTAACSMVKLESTFFYLLPDLFHFQNCNSSYFLSTLHIDRVPHITTSFVDIIDIFLLIFKISKLTQ